MVVLFRFRICGQISFLKFHQPLSTLSNFHHICTDLTKISKVDTAYTFFESKSSIAKNYFTQNWQKGGIRALCDFGRAVLSSRAALRGVPNQVLMGSSVVSCSIGY